MNIIKTAIVFITLQIVAFSALAQAPYFDLATFKEIVESAKDPVLSEVASGDEAGATNVSKSDASVLTQDQRIAQTAQKLRDFFTSASFAFNDRIIQTILQNARLYVEIIRERRENLKYLFGHPKAGLISDTKFGVDIIPNANFIRALMIVQSEALRDIAETGSKVLDVMAYPDRDSTTDAAIIYHHCIMAAAVGVNNTNCVAQNNIQLSKDKDAIARFERAYMISYRISRLAFVRFHEVIKLLGDNTIVTQNIRVDMHIEKNPEMMKYAGANSGYVLEEHYNQMTIFKVKEIEKWPECTQLRANHKAIKDIFNSQTGCAEGNFFFIKPCQFENNRRKISVPSIGLEFASVFFNDDTYEQEREYLSRFKPIKLKPICPVDPRYHYALD